jgi:hypothetical protein
VSFLYDSASHPKRNGIEKVEIGVQSGAISSARVRSAAIHPKGRLQCHESIVPEIRLSPSERVRCEAATLKTAREGGSLSQNGFDMTLCPAPNERPGNEAASLRTAPK